MSNFQRKAPLILSGGLALAGLGTPNFVEALKVNAVQVVSLTAGPPIAEAAGEAEVLCALLEIMKRDISEVLTNATNGGEPFPTEQIRAVFPQFQSGFEYMGLGDELKQVSIARIGAGGNCEGVFPYERRKDAGEDSDSLSPLPDKVAVKKIKRRNLPTQTFQSDLNLEVLEWKVIINEVVNMLMLNQAAEGLGGDELFSVVKLYRVYVSIEDVCEKSFTATVCLVQDLGDDGGDFNAQMRSKGGDPACLLLDLVDDSNYEVPNPTKVTDWLSDLKRYGEGLRQATAWYRDNKFGHGEIKPNNIILVKGKPALIDVASMHIFSDDGRSCKTDTCVHVSLPYVAPEKLSTVFTDRRTDYDLEATYRWDNFALGVVLLGALNAHSTHFYEVERDCANQEIARKIRDKELTCQWWNGDFLAMLSKTLKDTRARMEKLRKHEEIYKLYSKVYDMIKNLLARSSATFEEQLDNGCHDCAGPSSSAPDLPACLVRALSCDSAGSNLMPETPISAAFRRSDSTHDEMRDFMQGAEAAGSRKDSESWNVHHGKLKRIVVGRDQQ